MVETILLFSSALGGTVVEIAAKDLGAELQPVITCVKKVEVPYGINLLTGGQGVVEYTGQEAKPAILLKRLEGK